MEKLRELKVVSHRKKARMSQQGLVGRVRTRGWSPEHGSPGLSWTDMVSLEIL